MREIKFRAWCPKDHKCDSWCCHSPGEMDYVPFGEGSRLFFSDSGRLMETQGPRDETWSEESPLLLMQYTGLKDKNGKEIYEGDILQLGTDKIVYWVVEWDNRDDLPRGFAMTATYPQYLHPHVKETHIIGNIYENPELLSGK